MAPLKVTATVGKNIFTVEGDFVFDSPFQRAFTDLIIQTSSTPAVGDQAAIDRITKDTSEITKSAEAIGDMADQLGSVAPDAPQP